MDEHTFQAALRQVKGDLTVMNCRCRQILQLYEEQRRNQASAEDIKTSPPALEPSSIISLPSGPVFWQLFESLRDDIRGMDVRVERMENRFQSLEDRVRHLEAGLFTPTLSPTSETDGSVHAIDLGTSEKCTTVVLPPETSDRPDNIRLQSQPLEELTPVGRNHRQNP